MQTIETEAQLRDVIGAEIPGLAEKNQPCLNQFAIDFIAKSPFLVLSTADAEGRIDASPKGDGPGFVLVEDEQHLVIPDRPATGSPTDTKTSSPTPAWACCSCCPERPRRCGSTGGRH